MMPRDFLAGDEPTYINKSLPETTSGRDFLSEPEQREESLPESLLFAYPRIKEDVINRGYNFLTKVPEYYESAKTEIPGLFKTAALHPEHFLGQGIAGTQDLINMMAQTPRAISEYASNRLHLLPKSVPEFIKKVSPESTENAINALFGEPKYPGEALLRGSVPFIFPASAGSKAINLVSPTRTANKFARQAITDIQNQYSKGIKSQKLSYDQFFKPYGKNTITFTPGSYLNINKRDIKSLYPKTKKLYDEFLSEPNANNLHSFQSQLGKDAVKETNEGIRQKFRAMQEISQNKLESYAKSLNDPKAYEGLLEGKRITRDIVKPFEVTPTAKKIAKKNITPKGRNYEEVVEAVKKANEAGTNILDPLTGEVTGRIKGVPESHYLKSLEKELENKTNTINRRRLYKRALLGTAATAGGYELLNFMNVPELVKDLYKPKNVFSSNE